MSIEIQPATYKGVYGKAALFAFITIVCAVATELGMLWAINSGKIAESLMVVGIATAVCMLPLIVMSFVIAFVPSTAKALGIIYSVLQGGLLGAVCGHVLPRYCFRRVFGNVDSFSYFSCR